MYQEGIRVQGISHSKGHNIPMLSENTSSQPQGIVIGKGILQHGKFIFHILIPFFFPRANPIVSHKSGFRQIFFGNRLIAPIWIILETGNMITFLLHFFATQTCQLFPAIDIVIAIPVGLNQEPPREPFQKQFPFLNRNRLQMQGNPLLLAQLQHNFQSSLLIPGANRKIIGPIGHIFPHGFVDTS